MTKQYILKGTKDIQRSRNVRNGHMPADWTVLLVGFGKKEYTAADQLAMPSVHSVVLCYPKKANKSNRLDYSIFTNGNAKSRKADIVTEAIKRANPKIEVYYLEQAISMALLDIIQYKEERLFVFATINDRRLQMEINRYCIMNEIPCMHSFTCNNIIIGYFHHPNVTRICLECACKSIIKRPVRTGSNDKENWRGGIEDLVDNYVFPGLKEMFRSIQTENDSDGRNNIHLNRSLFTASIKRNSFEYRIIKEEHMHSESSCLFCTICKQNMKTENLEKSQRAFSRSLCQSASEPRLQE